MANTNSPQFQTYKPVEIVFSQAANYRDGDLTTRQDSHVINMYFDYNTQDDKLAPTRLKKRPGLVNTSYSLSKASSSDVIRGSFYDVDQNAFYWAVGNKLYAVKPDVGTTIRTVATLNTSSGYCGFCSYLKSDNTRYVCMSDGTDLWYDNYATTTCLRVLDADFPTPHRPYPVYIDGYIFLISASTGDIYNSVVDDISSWVPGDFITAEMSSDYGLALFKMKNHLVMMGYDSIEYFYDAGIATGSPLQRNDSPFQTIGYLGGSAQIGNHVVFVGHQRGQQIGVYVLSDFKIVKVSNDIVDRTIQNSSTTVNGKTQISADINGHSISVDGHNFYMLVAGNTTWVYDIDYKRWYEWQSPAGTGMAVEAAWTMYNGNCYVALANGTAIQMFSPNAYQDNGTNFTCQYMTDSINFGTPNWKYGGRLYLHCSQEAVSGTSNIGVSWSDKDWKDSAMTPRNINVFSVSPFINRLGRFRKRAFKITYTDNYPFWMVSMTMDINVGTH